MTIKDTFPTIFDLIKINDSVEKNNLDITNDTSFETLIELLTLSHEKIASIHSEEAFSIINTIFDEIISLKHQINESEKILRISYLQFFFGTILIYWYNRSGEFHYCHDLFHRSLYDKAHENFDEYDINKKSIIQFVITNDTYIKKHATDIVDQWFSELYYYSRSFSGLNDWGAFFLPLLICKLKYTNICNDNTPFLLSNLYVWCEFNSKTAELKDIYDLMKSLYRANEWTEENVEFKKGLGLQLLFCNETSIEDKIKLVKDLNSQTTSRPLERLQINAAITFNTSSLNENIENLITSINEYVTQVKKDSNDKISQTYEKARIFKVIYKPLLLALKGGLYSIASDMLSSYYDVENFDSKKILFIVPNEEDGLSYYLESKRVLNPLDTKEIILRIVDTKNKCFNSFTMLKGHEDNQSFSKSNKPIGVPDYNLGKSFLTELNKLYNFKLIEKDINTSSSMCQFAFNYLPIQSIMNMQVDKILPINLSLTNKNGFIPIKKILFWNGNSFTSEIEIESLKIIFKNSDISIDILDASSFGKEELLYCIKNDNHDIIWISSHGEHNHYEPNKSKIILSEGEEINIRDFEFLNQNLANRRLLFLNTCEGGLQTETGEFKNVGFPTLLTNENQDLLGHLWMVNSTIGMAYGILFGIGLTKGLNTFESYQFTIKTLLTGKKAVIEEISKTEPRLENAIDRINNADSLDWDNILSWGSSAYYI